MSRVRARYRSRGDSGQTAVLIVGFAVVLAMTVAVVVDASAAYLRRQGLNALADGAALAAADGVQGEQVYEGGLGARAEIDAAVARARVAEYLARVGAAGSYPGLRYAVVTGGDTVIVRVSAPLDLPLTAPGWPVRSRVTGTSAAVVAVSP